MSQSASQLWAPSCRPAAGSETYSSLLRVNDWHRSRKRPRSAIRNCVSRDAILPQARVRQRIVSQWYKRRKRAELPRQSSEFVARPVANLGPSERYARVRRPNRANSSRKGPAGRLVKYRTGSDELLRVDAGAGRSARETRTCTCTCTCTCACMLHKDVRALDQRVLTSLICLNRKCVRKTIIQPFFVEKRP